MHRQPLLDALHEYAARHPDEREMTSRFIGFVKQEPACFERSLQVGHVTGSTWVINAAGTHALFTHHRKSGAWLQLGGHADGDPDVLRVAMREAEEESGLTKLRLLSPNIFDVDIHPICARPGEPEHFHYDVRYLIQSTEDEPLVISDESHDLAWFDQDEIVRRFTDESILRMVCKWMD